MIIVVDGGSTKTRVSTVDGANICEYILPGINPFYQTEDEILKCLMSLPFAHAPIRQVFHYGAGCSFEEKKDQVRRAWMRLCDKAEVKVESDMMGAAKALFGNKRGIACILGTGANSCYYENGHVLENVPPLGFILGDEGSGANLGARLVANCMKNIYDKTLVDDFFKYFDTDAQSIMDGVYKKTFPSRYLASFVPFIADNIGRKEMNSLVEEAFRAFFERNVLLYKKDKKEVGFVGGVAKQFESQLRIVAQDYGFKHVVVLADPMNSLIAFHKANGEN